MATGVLSPSPVFTGLDQNGDPLPGGKLETYLAGTSTPAATYFDVGLTIPNANPVILDAAGRCVLYLVAAQSYKFILTNAAGAIQWTQDNITAGGAGSPTVDITGTAGEALGAGKVVYLADGTGGKVGGRWYLTDVTSNAASTKPVIGMTVASIGGGGSGVIRLAGVVPGLSGLTAGTIYNAGAVGTLAFNVIGQRVVGQADTGTSLVLGPRDLTPASSVVATTGTLALLPIPVGENDLFVILTPAAPLTIQGIAQGRPQQSITLLNSGPATVDLQHGVPAAGPGQLLNLATSAATSMTQGGWVTYRWDGAVFGVWRMIAHEQGSWIAPPYLAGGFTGSGSAWTVDAGDVLNLRYVLRGRSLTVTFALTTTSVAAGSSTLQIQNTMWGGFQVSSLHFLPLAFVTDAGVAVAARSISSGATIGMVKNDATNWGVAANSTGIFGQVTVDVV